MRDLETIESALRIAETGHLTFATLHTNSAASTINRIIDVFPSAQQAQIRAQRSEEHTSELQSRQYLVCRLLLEKKKPVKGLEHTDRDRHRHPFVTARVAP